MKALSYPWLQNLIIINPVHLTEEEDETLPDILFHCKPEMCSLFTVAQGLLENSQ